MKSYIKKGELFILTLIVLFTCSVSFAQSGVTNAPSNFQSTSQIMDIIEDKLWEDKEVIYDLQNVIGSPYLTEEFVEGKLFLGNKSYGNFLFRYNIFRDEIEIKKNTYAETESVRKVQGVSVLLENGITITVHNVLDDEGVTQPQFLVTLIEGDYTLAKTVRAKFSAPKEAETPLSAKKHAKFTKYEEFYLNNDGELKKIGTKKKDVLKLFPSTNSNKIKSYIAEHKINPKKEDDLIKLFNYANTL